VRSRKKAADMKKLKEARAQAKQQGVPLSPRMRQKANLSYTVARSKPMQPSSVTGADMLLSEDDNEPANKRRKKAKGKERVADSDK
jgi:hypothetical protein